MQHKEGRMITITVTVDDMYEAQKFAEARMNADVSLYKKRGGVKETDIYAGALAELAVYTLLKMKGENPTRPDFSVHSGKSYGADITTSKGKYHVKGQTPESKSRYGMSWLMQKSDPLVKTPSDEDFLVPCLVDGMDVTIMGIVGFDEIHAKKAFKEPRLDRFKDTKVALYVEDILPWL